MLYSPAQRAIAHMKTIVIPTPGLTSHGGVRVLAAIANRLVDQGCNVIIYVPDRPAVSPFQLDDRVVVRKVGLRSDNKFIAGVTFLIVLPMHLANRFVLANHFSTVFPAWLSSKWLGAKYVYFVQDIEYRFYAGTFYRIIKAACEWTYRRGRLIAANSYLATELTRYQQVLLTARLGVADSFFSVPSKSITKDFEIIYFLRGEKHKRADRFDAMLPFFLLKGFRVLCVSQNRSLLDIYSQRVATLCPKGDVDIIQALDKSKILLLTSDHEGFALPPLEAMARGVPPVMFECGGPSVYATHEKNCLIVDDGKEQTALKFVEQLLENGSLYAALSESGRATAQGFRLNDAIDALADYLLSAA
jgi:glycosyltransferase involved in cell wall biosynthesis